MGEKSRKNKSREVESNFFLRLHEILMVYWLVFSIGATKQGCRPAGSGRKGEAGTVTKHGHLVAELIDAGL